MVPKLGHWMVTTCKSSIHLSKESEPSSQGEARQGKEAVIDFVTIASTGNAQDFGDLTQAKLMPAAAASASPQVRSRIQPWGIFLFVA